MINKNNNIKPKVYIASPYTIGDKIENVNRQIDTSDTLMNLGFIPFVPLYSHYQHVRHPRSYDSWMELDYAWIDSCDCLLRLDGESSGADKEVEHARLIGIPVFYDVNKLSAYYTNNEPELTITETQYSELKRLYQSDSHAIKFPFPITVVPVENENGLVRVNFINESPKYITDKLPWLLDLQNQDAELGRIFKK